MLKYNSIISKLDIGQKIRLLTDINELSSEDMTLLGIPSFKIGSMKDVMRDVYPGARMLSHSFDRGLWSRVSDDLSSSLAEAGTGFAISPGARIKLSPLRREFTEDPYLATILAGEYQASLNRHGISSAASGCYLNTTDADFMDREPDDEIVERFLVAPYKKSMSIGEAEAVVVNCRIPSDEYRDVNSTIHRAATADGKLIIAEKVGDSDTVSFIRKGGICLSGSSLALTAAVQRHEKLKRSLDSSTIDLSDYEKELEEGGAITPEEIDLAVDKLLTVAFKASSVRKDTSSLSAKDRRQLALDATLGSTVLLKNTDNLLPIKPGKRIGIIGGYGMNDDSFTGIEHSLAAELVGYGYRISNVLKGYDIGTDTEVAERASVKRLAEESDTVLLILGMGAEREKQTHLNGKLTLPANQLLVADMLEKYGNKVTVIINSGHSVDVEFTHMFSGLLYAPIGLKYSAEALSMVLSGESDPKGRLAFTLYAATDRAFTKRKAYKLKYGRKSGPFIGYRYYDTADMRVGFPFGYGLSYAKTEFSSLSVGKGSVSVTVRNCSDRPANATVQVYIGMENSNALRPKKELCGFCTVSLAPREKKRVEISTDQTVGSVYMNGKYVTEGGNYIYYVGTSVSDVRLKAGFSRKGEKLPPTEEKLSDYIETASNIIDQKYTLEANYKPMKRNVRNILFGIGSVILGIAVAVFNSVTALSAVFLNVVTALLVITGIIFFILEIKDRSTAYKIEKQRISEENKLHFEDADAIPNPNAQSLFKEEFDHIEEETVTAEAEAIDLDVDKMGYIDKGFTLKDASDDLSRFVLEHGYKLDRSGADSILAAMTSSRSIIFDNLDSKTFSDLVMILSEYFGTDLCIDKMENDRARSSSLFYSIDENGEYVRKNSVTAIENARNKKESVHIAAFSDAENSELLSFFTPLMRYAKNPGGRSPITCKRDDGTEINYHVDSNLYFFINLKKDNRTADIPEPVARLSTVISLRLQRSEAPKDRRPFKTVSYYQIEYITDALEKAQISSEDSWKKVDKLEAYAKEISGYSIGNKLWLSLETHISALVSMETDFRDALDVTLATRLIPSMISALNGKITKDTRGLADTVALLFGEESVPLCRDTVNKANMDPAN